MGKRRLQRAVLFGLPVLLWMAVIYAGSSQLGVFATSARLVQATLHLLAPEFPPQLDQNGFWMEINLFVLNLAVRRLTHVLAYAVLALLLVRLIQQGEPRLKRASVIGTLLLSLIYVGADELHRYYTPERHAKWLDLYLNLIGVFLVLTGTVLWFWVKAWERWLASDASPASPDALPARPLKRPGDDEPRPEPDPD